jgi:menaquinol-cytochrome c reductase iron-sulfur subunit
MDNTNTSRRSFLGLLTAVLMAVIGFLVAIPAIGYFFGPLRRRSGTADDAFQDVGALADVPIGQWRLLSVEKTHEDGWKRTRVRHAIWVRRRGEDPRDITVFSSICPHLGCPINWITDQSQFFCPCHGAIFDVNGRCTGGPPPRGMDPLEHEVRAGRLWVRWQDFKIGVAERVPVNI